MAGAAPRWRPDAGRQGAVSPRAPPSATSGHSRNTITWQTAITRASSATSPTTTSIPSSIAHGTKKNGKGNEVGTGTARTRRTLDCAGRKYNYSVCPAVHLFSPCLICAAASSGPALHAVQSLSPHTPLDAQSPASVPTQDTTVHRQPGVSSVRSIHKLPTCFSVSWGTTRGRMGNHNLSSIDRCQNDTHPSARPRSPPPSISPFLPFFLSFQT